jgi:carboxymethylenebutenolidase
MMRAMPPRTIEIKTDDGTCPAYVFQPEGSGPWPGVLLYMDGIGIRQALFDMGDKLASAGYYVLLPDLFYRGGPYEPVDAKKIFVDADMRAALSKKLASLATIELIMRDTRAFLAHLASQPQVAPGKIGVTGYCMGGRMALAAAGQFPDRIAAAAAFHPGGLATDAPDSPHLLAPKISAQLYIGAAMEDQNFSAEQIQRLEQALTAAGVKFQLETFPCRHGWVPADTLVHDPAGAERHWKILLDLFARTLS